MTVAITAGLWPMNRRNAIWRGDSDLVARPSTSSGGASGTPAASGTMGVVSIGHGRLEHGDECR